MKPTWILCARLVTVGACLTNPTALPRTSKLLAIRYREGLTHQEASDRRGLARATSSWWSWRLRRESVQSVPGFSELEVVDDEGPLTAAADGLRIRIAVVVEVPSGAAFSGDPARLHRDHLKEMAALLDEVRRLRARLSVLEGGSDTASDGT